VCKLVKEEKGFRFIGYKRDEEGAIHIKDLSFTTGKDTENNLEITLKLKGWMRLTEIPQILRDMGWMYTQFADGIVGQLADEVAADESRY